jgi:tryptophan synthase alpha chain
MINRIDLAFKKGQLEKRPLLITYSVCGDPNKKKSLEILKSISEHADLVEWGFAFNSPTADGPDIQNSTYRAIKNGINLKRTFELVKNYKRYKNSKPLILMGYYQIIFHYGEKKFVKKCQEVGVDGLIVVDLPWPDNKNFARLCKKNSICFVQLIAPTTTKKRMKMIIKDSHQLLYQISMISTTGNKLKVSANEIIRNNKIIKRINPKKNIVVGFGITKSTISSLKECDGLVIGSAVCKAISTSLKRRQNPIIKLNKMVKGLKSKII